MGRARMNTEQVTFRIDCDLLSKLKSINPSLLTRDSVSGNLKFRHGALGRYLARLVTEDITRREKLLEDEVLASFLKPKENEQ